MQSIELLAMVVVHTIQHQSISVGFDLINRGLLCICLSTPTLNHEFTKDSLRVPLRVPYGRATSLQCGSAERYNPVLCADRTTSYLIIAASDPSCRTSILRCAIISKQHRNRSTSRHGACSIKLEPFPQDHSRSVGSSARRCPVACHNAVA